MNRTIGTVVSFLELVALAAFLFCTVLFRGELMLALLAAGCLLPQTLCCVLQQYGDALHFRRLVLLKYGVCAVVWLGVVLFRLLYLHSFAIELEVVLLVLFCWGGILEWLFPPARGGLEDYRKAFLSLVSSALVLPVLIFTALFGLCYASRPTLAEAERALREQSVVWLYSAEWTEGRLSVSAEWLSERLLMGAGEEIRSAEGTGRSFSVWVYSEDYGRLTRLTVYPDSDLLVLYCDESYFFYETHYEIDGEAFLTLLP